MPVFDYAYRPSPFANTIAELLAHQNDPAAQAARIKGDLSARAIEASGQATSDMIRGITHAGTSAMDTLLEAQRQAPIVAANKIKLAQLQTGQAAQEALSRGLQGDQLPPGDVGPRQPTLMTPDGLYDIPAVTQWLNTRGYGAQAPEMIASAEKINEAITNHQQKEQALATAKVTMFGYMADGTQQMVKAGMPMDQALDAAAAPGIASKRFTPEEYAAQKARILELPPAQQMAALEAMKDAAARVNKTEPATEYGRMDVFGRITGAAAPKKHYEQKTASVDGGPPQLVNYDPATGDSYDVSGAKITGKIEPAAPRTEGDKERDAYAKFIGKKSGADLTYADLQTMAKEKARIASDIGFAQHMRERAFDNANPPPVDQNKLETGYRTALLRAVSSRSGGLGLEDQKVLQANHLLVLMDQNFDPKTQTYKIPPTQYSELALGLARLLSPSGNVGIELEQKLEQATAKGDVAQMLTYITGQPVTGSTQAVFKQLRDSIQRQGEVATSNREGGMGFLRALAPTELDETRRTALEQASLKALYKSRVIQMPDGSMRMQTSDDGGTTWK